MALSFSNCLTPRPGVNEMYEGCCCDIQCTVTTDIPVLIEDIISVFTMESFYFASPPKAYINGVLQTFPFFLGPNESFSLEMEICAPSVGNLDALDFNFLMGGAGSQKFEFIYKRITIFFFIWKYGCWLNKDTWISDSKPYYMVLLYIYYYNFMRRFGYYS